MARVPDMTAADLKEEDRDLLKRNIALHRALAARLPGYLVPRLVREIAGEPGKTPLQAINAGFPAAG